MKISEAIAQVDALRPNSYTVDQKIGWLSRVDAMVKRNVISTHEGAENCPFNGYGPGTDRETELLMPEPYDEGYLCYLEAMMAKSDMEYDGYNTAIIDFDARYRDYGDWYNRTHMPLQPKPRYF